MLGRHLLAGRQVGRDVLADGRVRAPARLDRLDALRFQRRVPQQELAVLLREDVVGDLAKRGWGNERGNVRWAGDGARANRWPSMVFTAAML